MITRDFCLADQLAFGELSGDFNPVHVDPVAARRSLFGAAVVHGIHSLLWALDVWSQDRPQPFAIYSIRADFARPIRLGDVVSYSLVSDLEGQTQIHLLVDQFVTTKIKLKWSHASTPELNLFTAGFPPREDPKVLAIRDAENASGALPLYLHPAAAARLFPHLVAALPIAQLLATTRLVGMECPGLHSFYSSLDVSFREDANITPVLAYEVTKLDPRYGIVMIGLNSPHMTGKVTAFFRPPRQEQAHSSALQDLVSRNEFAGQRALVVGGSRGLGEVAAKLLAAGGADVKVTYHQGADDAHRVAAEITAEGGTAGCLQLNVLDQTHTLGDSWTPTHLYYFASPQIATGRPGAFSSALFQVFCNYYVLGFHRLVEGLCALGLKYVFYPSTVFIDELPPELSEYAVAKMAGEELCRYLEKAHPDLHIYRPRLPRMSTDQTASFMPTEQKDPVPVLLEHLYANR
jgi:hypothetical protein